MNENNKEKKSKIEHIVKSFYANGEVTLIRVNGQAKILLLFIYFRFTIIVLTITPAHHVCLVLFPSFG